MEDKESYCRENIGERDARHRRKLKEWNDAKEVIDQDESEESEEIGNELKEVMPDDLSTQTFADKVVDTFTCELEL